MSTILNILNQIADEPGKNAKISIIKEHLDNDVFVKVLHAALNPFNKPYNIKQTPIITNHTNTLTLVDFLDDLHLFQDRIVSGHDARDKLKDIFQNLTEGDAEVAKRIIKKDFRAGFSESSVNKALRGCIPVYPCLRATAESDKAKAKITYPASSQIKSDGMRANLFFENNTIELRSRSGKVIDLLGEFDYLVGKDDDCVLDGELMMIESNGKLMSRKKGNGLLNKAVRGTMTLEIAKNVIYVVWDRIPLSDFRRLEKHAAKDAPTYTVRFQNTTDLVEKINSNRIRLIECRTVNNLEEANEHYAEAIAKGEEGIILKNWCHPWENRKSQHLVKFKQVLDCDLEVIGWKPGTEGTKNEGKIGSLICASRDRKVIANARGITDDLADEIFKNLDYWVNSGKIIAIKYNERISDKNRPDVDSLYHPRFLEERLDKDIADLSEDIK